MCRMSFVSNLFGRRRAGQQNLRDRQSIGPDYGYLLPAASSPEATVWWCESGWKVGRDNDRLPQSQSGSLQMAAPGGDWEAVQLVLRPKGPMKLLGASATDLAGPDGHRIAASNIRVLRVFYHWVEHPTDSTGIAGLVAGCPSSAP